MGNTKWTHLLFAAGGLLIALIMVKAADWVWGFFGKPQDLYVLPAGFVAAAAITLHFWRSETWFTQAHEITVELGKVTWPARKETSAATVVVIITVIIFSIFLKLFDMVWAWATGLIYQS